MKMAARNMSCALTLGLLLTPCFAQDVAIGTPPFASLGGSPDVVNLGNLNANLTIPILNNPGRGLNMTYNLSYDSSIWYPVTSNGTTTWNPANSYGWQGLTPANVGSITYAMSYSSGTCGQYNQGTYQVWTFGSVVYTDQTGTVHNIPASGSYINATAVTGCPASGGNPSGTVEVPLSDGSGLTADYSLAAGSMSIYLVTASNTTLYPPVNNGGGTTSETDSNGNEISLSNGAYTDTLGNSSILKITGQAPEVDISYIAPSGSYAAYKVTFKQYNIHTYFQCNSIGEYTAVNAYLVDRVTLPDSTYYQFQYEETYAPGYSGYYSGRLASVTLPAGGTISYTYTGGNNNTGIECMDGSTAGLTRTLSPGGQWTYARSSISGTTPHGSKWSTTVTDPADHDGARRHDGIAGVNPTDDPTAVITRCSGRHTHRDSWPGISERQRLSACRRSGKSQATHRQEARECQRLPVRFHGWCSLEAIFFDVHARPPERDASHRILIVGGVKRVRKATRLVRFTRCWAGNLLRPRQDSVTLTQYNDPWPSSPDALRLECNGP